MNIKNKIMFNSKNRKLKHLNKKYKKILEKSFQFSTVNRRKSDHYAEEAEKISEQIKQLTE